MAFKFGKASSSRLYEIHPDLQKVARRALVLSPVDFGISCGLRTLAEQKELFDAGASKTMDSRHLTGHALDFVCYINGKVSWSWPLYNQVAAAFKVAAQEAGVPIVWGGDWRSFKDGPHIELDRNEYS